MELMVIKELREQQALKVLKEKKEILVQLVAEDLEDAKEKKEILVNKDV